MKQKVRFKVPGKLDTLNFKPGSIYTLTITDGQWIVYRGKRRTTLSAFANWYIDTGYAEFIESTAA